MKLEKYILQKMEKEEKWVTVRMLLVELSEKCDASLSTLQHCTNGYRMDSYSKAKTVSKATGGKVTIKELCEK